MSRDAMTSAGAPTASSAGKRIVLSSAMCFRQSSAVHSDALAVFPCILAAVVMPSARMTLTALLLPQLHPAAPTDTRRLTVTVARGRMESIASHFADPRYTIAAGTATPVIAAPPIAHPT